MTSIARPAANRIRAFYWSAAALVLVLPAIAMNVTAEIVWGPADFAVMAGMLALVGLGIEMVLRASLAGSTRLSAIAAMIGLFLLIWAELAVGLFD